MSSNSVVKKIRYALRWLPDEAYIQLNYFARFHKFANLRNPETFNEKLNWLKLHDHNPIYTGIVDKYTAKEYAEKIIGSGYCIPTLGVWDSFDDIDFDSLPNQFVLKCTHDSESLVIVSDKSKFDKATAKQKIEDCLKRNFYYVGREWPYKNVPPRIIAEQYLEDTETDELRDYKFFCFNGQVKCFKVDFNRFKSHRANYFDINGNLIKIGEEKCPPDFEKNIELPDNLDKMIQLAEELAVNNTFLRVDFYDVNGKIYFGELTFFPASGFGKFIFEGNDEMLGKWIKLPNHLSCMR